MRLSGIYGKCLSENSKLSPIHTSAKTGRATKRHVERRRDMSCDHTWSRDVGTRHVVLSCDRRASCHEELNCVQLLDMSHVNLRNRSMGSWHNTVVSAPVVVRMAAEYHVEKLICESEKHCFNKDPMGPSVEWPWANMYLNILHGLWWYMNTERIF